MKLTTTFMLASVVAGCSSSSPERTGTIEERQERIENERSARSRDRLYGPGKPEAVDNDFDQDGDGIADADETHAEADDTALNERDRAASSLTPIDQSNAASDVEITQTIRKRVIGDDDLSFNAKNIKIITVSGKVTLRGPVENTEERAIIERSARDVPGVTRVENQLEVK